jgi:hypothetical protein
MVIKQAWPPTGQPKTGHHYSGRVRPGPNCRIHSPTSTQLGSKMDSSCKITPSHPPQLPPYPYEFQSYTYFPPDLSQELSLIIYSSQDSFRIRVPTWCLTLQEKVKQLLAVDMQQAPIKPQCKLRSLC